jgi:hypothetical protein
MGFGKDMLFLKTASVVYNWIMISRSSFLLPASSYVWHVFESEDPSLRGIVLER